MSLARSRIGGFPPISSRGFTLLEVLVVMSLLSLVMLAMGSALRTTAQTEERIDQKLLRADEMRVANDFLRGILGRISAQKTTALVPAGQSPFLFEGRSAEVTWIGIMPARYGVGGRYYFRLGLEKRGVSPALVLRFLPWQTGIAPDWTQAQTYTLVENIVSLGIQYQAANADPQNWTAQWSSIEALPQRVMLSLQVPSGAWPDVVVTMRVLPGSDPLLSDGPVFGRSLDE